MQARARMVAFFYGTFLFASGVLFMPIEMQCLCLLLYYYTYTYSIYLYILHTHTSLLSLLPHCFKSLQIKKKRGAVLCATTIMQPGAPIRNSVFVTCQKDANGNWQTGWWVSLWNKGNNAYCSFGCLFYDSRLAYHLSIMSATIPSPRQPILYSVSYPLCRVTLLLFLFL